jgi:hypothetical protein
MAKEYKRYDSPCFVEYHNARIATDQVTCVASKNDEPLVRFKVVADSRNDRFEPLWLEVNVGKFNAKAASFLEKDDVLSLRGRLAMRLWGDDNDKVAISVEFAELFMSGELISKLKERGFDPDGEPNYTDEGSGKKKGKGKDKKKSGKPDPKKTGKPGKKAVEIPPDEDDDDASDDDDGDVEIDEDDTDAE